MTRKEREITELYTETLLEITQTKEKWMEFLKSASYNYKYRFDEQVLIYAQRPNATACAETTIWNKIFKRWVNKNTKAIALLTENEGQLGLKFVFDVADTNSNVYKRTFKLWSIQEKYKDEIIETLENNFGKIENKEYFSIAIMSSITGVVEDNFQDYFTELQNEKVGAKLEKYDDEKLKNIFKELLIFNTAYLIFSRSDIAPNEVFTDYVFDYIKDFSTYDTINILGSATRDISRGILLEISRTITSLEKNEKKLSRTFDNKSQNNYHKNIEKDEGSIKNDNIYIERGLSNTRLESTREQENKLGQIRIDEVKLPKEKQPNEIHNAINKESITEPLDRNKQNSPRASTEDNRTTSNEGGNNRGIESTRSSEMDRLNEQLQNGGRGASDEGDYIQLEIPTEETQKKIIAGAENASVLSFDKKTTDDKEDSLIKTNIQIKRRNKIEQFDLHPEIPLEKRHNFKIENNELGVGGLKEKYKRNIEAIKILKKCREEDRYATLEEQKALSEYVGWGGLQEAFNSNNSNWSNEYKELKNLLTEKEYNEAKQSILTAFYTPPVVIKSIYKALQNMGLERGNILEPSCRYW